MADFGGFPTQTTTFLKKLRMNNSKAWFDEHRSDYDDYWIAPARSFVVAAGEALQKLAPVRYEPKIGGSIFRINRDIRFSKDKSPYKDYLDFWFWEGDRAAAVSGFYLRIGPTVTRVGVGAHRFHPDQLAKYRRSIANGATRPALVKAISTVEKAGYPLKGSHYKTVPRGFDVDDAQAERLLKHNALWVDKDQRHPRQLRSVELVSWAMAHWRKSAPIHRWLVDTIQ